MWEGPTDVLSTGNDKRKSERSREKERVREVPWRRKKSGHSVVRRGNENKELLSDPLILLYSLTLSDRLESIQNGETRVLTHQRWKRWVVWRHRGRYSSMNHWRKVKKIEMEKNKRERK